MARQKKITSSLTAEKIKVLVDAQPDDDIASPEVETTDEPFDTGPSAALTSYTAAKEPAVQDDRDVAPTPQATKAPSAPKATTAHGFQLLGAYAGAKSCGGDVEKALRSVLSGWPADIRRKAIAIAISKEMPKSPVVELLKRIYEEQPTPTSTGNGGAHGVRGVAKRRKIVAVREGKGGGLWIGATEEMIAAKSVDVTINHDGSITVRPAALGVVVADDSTEGEAIDDVAAAGGV